MKPTRTEAASDPFAVLKMMVEVAAGNLAGFVSPPETTGIAAEFEQVPAEVDASVGLIIESSGSTGRPKRIELSLAALMASAEASASRLGGHGQWLLALPANYVAGANVLFRSVVADTQPVIMNSRVPFSAEGFKNSSNLMQHPIRYTSLVPIQLDRLAAATVDPAVLAALRSFQAILVGGQLPNTSSIEHLKSLGVNVVESYGMAETSGGCVYDGVPLEGVELEIVDGKVVVSGPVLANGLGQAFATQDLAEIVDGKLKFLGRADRVIISGGKKVSLDDVEQRVLELDSVSEAMAVAVASKWGQSAVLLVAGPKTLELAELNAVLEGPAKAIAFRQLDELPRLESGKPDYQAAKQLLAD